MQLRKRAKYPRAIASWALDSGAFTQISSRGRFIDDPKTYVQFINRYAQEIGRLEWAAPQDHMTEREVLSQSQLASTIGEAQSWTIKNYLDLMEQECLVPIIPVLQGETFGDYSSHVDQYLSAGVDLFALPLVGLGSVCRRQSSSAIVQLVAELHQLGLKLHGFGIKTTGIRQYGSLLASSDSMAWSYRARAMGTPCPFTDNINCANCLHFAYQWRMSVLQRMG